MRDDEPTHSDHSDLVSGVLLLTQYLEGADHHAGRNFNFSHDRAGARALSAALDAEKEISDLNRRVEYLERLAITDELSGLLNRRGFERELNHALETAKRYDETGALILIDLNKFKPVNDTYGHAAGDAVLCRVAEILKGNTRSTDFTARLGGDEFGILMTRTDRANAMIRARHFDRLLNSAAVDWNGRQIPLSASLGFMPYKAGDATPTLMNQVDLAMYDNKRSRDDTAERQRSA